VRRLTVPRSQAIDGRSAPKCQGKWPDQPPDHRSGCPMRWWPSSPRRCLAGRPVIREYSRQIGSHLGNPGLCRFHLFSDVAPCSITRHQSPPSNARRWYRTTRRP
jgi:hypothetical protein